MRSTQIHDLFQQAIVQQNKPSSGDRPGPHDQAYWMREQARFTAEVAAQLSDIKYALLDLVSRQQTLVENATVSAVASTKKTRTVRGKPIKSEARAERRPGMSHRTFYIVEYVQSDPPKFDSITQKFPRELEESGIKVHRALASTAEDAVLALRKLLKQQRGLMWVDDEGKEITG